MTFVALLASFFLKPETQSAIEKNFLYLLVSILSSAPSENLRTNNLIFAIVLLFMKNMTVSFHLGIKIKER
jgi:hypothetical protein